MNIDKNEVVKAIETLHPDAELFEIRVLAKEVWNNGKTKTLTYSGYFKDSETAAEQLQNLQVKGQVYITLNSIKDSCYARLQKDKLMQASETTKDEEITERKYLFVDFDAKRESGISSTAEEKEKALQKAKEVYKYTKGLGLNEPIVADSGNGLHLLYRISIPKENDGIIKRVLQRLDALFTDDAIGVDTTVSNAARICKLYGTMACKGADTPERPHRQARLLYIPDEYHSRPNTLEQLERIAEPEETAPNNTQKNYYNSSNFDLQDFIQRHNIPVKETKQLSDRTVYVLQNCIFDESHKNKDAAIMQFSDGRLAYNCFHNSCSDKHWHEVRLLFEPDAYNTTKNSYTYLESKPNHKQTDYIQKLLDTDTEQTPDFYQIKDIQDEPENTYICTGIRKLDEKQKGLGKGELTIISGKRGAGKTTLLTQIILQAREQGYKTLWYNAEMKLSQTAKWVHYIASGHNYVKQSANRQEDYNLDAKVVACIDSWVNDYIYFINTEKELDWEKLATKLIELIPQKQIDLLVIDNLMTIDLSYTSTDDQYNKQTVFIKNLVKIAQKFNIHIVLVAHPRKSQTGTMLTADDIAGTGNITNLAHNVMILHRVNQSFKNEYKSKYRLQQDDENCKSTNCIEIVKNRDTGRQDYFIPLYYDATCRQLQNAKQENRQYSWIENCNGLQSYENDWELFTEQEQTKPNDYKLKQQILTMIDKVRASEDGVLKVVYKVHPALFEGKKLHQTEHKNARFLQVFESIPDITHTSYNTPIEDNRYNISIEFGTVTELRTDNILQKGEGVVIRDKTKSLDGNYTEEQEQKNDDFLESVFPELEPTEQAEKVEGF